MTRVSLPLGTSTFVLVKPRQLLPGIWHYSLRVRPGAYYHFETIASRTRSVADAHETFILDYTCDVSLVDPRPGKMRVERQP